ncbi:MAG: hypothetical protein V4556_06170 [Bacteroidota bacterium]
MKKVFLLATAALLVSGVTFADHGKRKKKCCKKEKKCGTTPRACHKKKAATATL